MADPTITQRPVDPNNYHTGRTMQPDRIVVHVTEGDRGSVRAWFNDPNNGNASSHFMVCTDGSIDEFVALEDRPFAQGVVDRPTAAIVLARHGVNPNQYCVSIEHEGDGQHELTEPQRASSLWLIHHLVGLYPAITLDREHILGHHEIRASKTCPGKIDVDRLVRELNLQPGPIVAPDVPRVKWSPFLKDYVVVTKYVTDQEWYFTPLSQVQGVAVRAGSRLSDLPDHPGVAR
jgi:N-acetyl-anhydromuramyl-L-alanine amidase AmpD